MSTKLLIWLTRNRPSQDVVDDGIIHFTKFWMFNLFGFQVFLHKFGAGIPNANPHTHTYRRALSLILSGWYEEDIYDLSDDETRYSVKRRKNRWFNVLYPKMLHNIVNAAPGTWTLFIAAPSTRPYSFYDLKNYRMVTPKRQKYSMWYKPQPDIKEQSQEDLTHVQDGNHRGRGRNRDQPV